jgi:hypothetical protein
MTPATENGYRPILGAHTTRPTWHYKLTPGEAYLIDGSGENKVVPVTQAMADRATDTHLLKWISGKTVAVFEVDGVQHAQPIAVNAGPVALKKDAPKPKKQHRAPPAAVAEVQGRREAPKRAKYEPL